MPERRFVDFEDNTPVVATGWGRGTTGLRYDASIDLYKKNHFYNIIIIFIISGSPMLGAVMRLDWNHLTQDMLRSVMRGVW